MNCTTFDQLGTLPHYSGGQSVWSGVCVCVRWLYRAQISTRNSKNKPKHTMWCQTSKRALRQHKSSMVAGGGGVPRGGRGGDRVWQATVRPGVVLNSCGASALQKTLLTQRTSCFSDLPPRTSSKRQPLGYQSTLEQAVGGYVDFWLCYLQEWARQHGLQYGLGFHLGLIKNIWSYNNGFQCFPRC